ncbi:hypothetical protein Golomagni_07327, partial [Golovinomyces magnicellulatus]
SGRKLGGGRILGSGRGLAPPTPQTAPRATSPLPPSESTASLGSSSMSPPASGSLPDLSPDIGSSISIGAQPKPGMGDVSELMCPICNEAMLTLLQLNRHIDDTHQELPEEEQDEVKTWFDKQVHRAKRFQPLSMLNQKLRGLDVFESNESQHPTVQVAHVPGRAIPEAPVDPDEFITRHHWQRSTTHDLCTDPACGKNLGPINGSINCRKCGRLFCEEHTMYQMKLSRSANHEPVRGYWARVCETCYKSRDGYNDHTGVSVDHTSKFTDIRRKRVDRQKLEVSRLEKRLTKLTRLLADAADKPPSTNGSLLAPMTNFTSQKNARKAIEQSVVTWEDDESVPQCPFCKQEFGSWTFRRHHCRVCGKVVCADPQTKCSSDISLNVASCKSLLSLRLESTYSHIIAVDPATEKPIPGSNQVAVEVRMCQDCSHTIFSGRDFTAALQLKSADQRAYETMKQFERGISQL